MQPPILRGANPIRFLNRGSEPWSYNPQESEIRYKGISVSATMQQLVEQNEELAFYPKLLELRALAMISDWRKLPSKGKKQFLDKDKKRGWEITNNGVSKSFAIHWHTNVKGLGSLDNFTAFTHTNNNSGGSTNGGGLNNLFPIRSNQRGPTNTMSNAVSLDPDEEIAIIIDTGLEEESFMVMNDYEDTLWGGARFMMAFEEIMPCASFMPLLAL